MISASTMKKIAFIGSGNVATHLVKAFYNNGYDISEIYSRTYLHAIELGKMVNANPVKQISELGKADLTFISVKDDAIVDVISQLIDNNGLYLHTAGSVSIDSFQSKVQNYGVFYPLQTFSKNKRLKIWEVPVFYEANSKKNSELIKSVASTISDSVHYLNSEQRKILHIAAVYVNNFSNHMFTAAGVLMEDQNLPFEYMLPLIRETVNKLESLNPKNAQTGPALRNDQKILQAHMNLLRNKKDLRFLYKVISDSIKKFHDK